MAVTAKPYPSFVKAMANKEIDLDTDTIKVMLLTSSYTPNAAHDYHNDLTNEVTGTGYTAGGATLGSKTVAITSTDVWTFDAADVSWTTSTITARYAVVYDDSPGTSATKPLIALIDFGENVSSTAGTFSITWNAAGIVSSDAGWA